MEGTQLYRGLGEKGEILLHHETFITGESERDVKKEGAGKGQLCIKGPRWGTCRRVRLPGTLTDSKGALVTRASLSMGAL